ncbi:uncharacterized protein VTP21DRAFT_2639 [Calcarisporiella thermophila]|uniref:uncharacterized protein n=1 Tax=Calcarisporiella thermophila TaxID=911321 RepID=UPI0037420371
MNLTNALQNVYNISPVVAFPFGFSTVLGMFHSGGFQLSDLNPHNVVEHDASITRSDFGTTPDYIKLNQTLLEQFLSMSKDGQYITLDDIKRVRKLREQQCKAENPRYSFDMIKKMAANFEAVTIVFVFGDGKKAPVKWIREWFTYERLPADWQRPQQPVGLNTLMPLAQLLS